MKEKVTHVLRPPIPWRVHESTLCGRAYGDYADATDLDGALALVKELGIQRASFQLCMTCMDRIRFGGVETFEKSPIVRLSAEGGAASRSAIEIDLRALADLAALYPEEFAELRAKRAGILLLKKRRQEATS